MSEYETQCDQLLELLRVRGERGLTAMEVLSEIGSARAAARVKDLRDRGHHIRTERVKTRRGASVAKYVYEPPVPAEAEPFEEQSLWA